MNRAATVLLVEDDVEFGRLVQTMLSRSRIAFDVQQVYQLSDALIRLARGGVDVVLLDLALPDAAGLGAFTQVRHAAPETPVVILSASDDPAVARKAMHGGAQDVLVKGQIDMRTLDRVLIYAIDRQQGQAERERHLAQLAILRDVDEELNSRLDLDYVLTMALDTAVRLSLASAGVIGLVDDDELVVSRNINYDPAALPDTPMLRLGVVGRALQNRQAQRVMDVHADKDYLPLLPRTRAQMVIPLLSQNRVIGFLNLETIDPVRFTDETFAFLKLLAARIASAIDNARLYETTQMQLTELKTLYDQVRDLEQLKTDMIRIATHDLRGPLNNIAQSLYIMRRLQDSETDPRFLTYLGCIETAANRMKAIATDILALERLESMESLHASPVDLRKLTEQAFREYQGQARRKAQYLAMGLTARPIVVQGEEALLYEAVTNLVGNAVKYTPDGGNVEVLVRRNAHTVTLKVTDTGIGIPTDQQERLFQPFFRAQSQEMTGIDGTGLGLHLVKNIITRHNGQMLFKSVYGEGSTFGFRLPLA